MIDTKGLTHGAKIPAMNNPSIGLPRAPDIVLTACLTVPSLVISKPKIMPSTPLIAA